MFNKQLILIFSILVITNFSFASLSSKSSSNSDDNNRNVAFNSFGECMQGVSAPSAIDAAIKCAILFPKVSMKKHFGVEKTASFGACLEQMSGNGVTVADVAGLCGMLYPRADASESTEESSNSI